MYLKSKSINKKSAEAFTKQDKLVKSVTQRGGQPGVTIF